MFPHWASYVGWCVCQVPIPTENPPTAPVPHRVPDCLNPCPYFGEFKTTRTIFFLHVHPESKIYLVGTSPNRPSHGAVSLGDTPHSAAPHRATSHSAALVPSGTVTSPSASDPVTLPPTVSDLASNLLSGLPILFLNNIQPSLWPGHQPPHTRPGELATAHLTDRLHPTSLASDSLPDSEATKHCH